MYHLFLPSSLLKLLLLWVILLWESARRLLCSSLLSFPSFLFVVSKFQLKTKNKNKHSSRMRTAHLLPVSPSMHWSGVTCVGVYLVLGGGGVHGPRGCTWSWGGVPGPGGCTWSRGVYLVLVGGVPGLGGVPGPGGCTYPGGVPGPRGCTWSQGVYLPGGYLPRYSPREQNDWQTGVKT